MKQFYIIILSATIFSCSTSNNDVNDCCYPLMEKVYNYKELKLDLDIAFDDLGSLNGCAREMDKPILTIYGGFASMGDPKELWRPLADKAINDILKTDFLIRYYRVDNRTMLPDSMKRDNTNTIGEYFARKQIENYNSNTQPLYTITNWKEEDLVKPISRVSKNDFYKFKNFLLEGSKTNANNR